MWKYFNVNQQLVPQMQIKKEKPCALYFYYLEILRTYYFMETLKKIILLNLIYAQSSEYY